MRKTITIEEVAQRAGIGLGTASRALSGRGSVSPKTRTRVLEIASQLGYEANPHAQRLANGGVNNTIAIFAGIDLGIATLRLWQISSCLNERNYIADIHLVPSFVADREQKQIRILRDLRRLNPAAIVSQSMQLDNGARRELQQYQDSGGVLVMFDERIDLQCDQIIFDQEDTVYQAANHLLNLGHQTISYIGHIAKDGPKDLRWLGIQRALRERNMPPIKEQLTYRKHWDESAGPALVEQYFALKRKPTAVISNDTAASVFMHALIRRGVRVPEDISIVGYDNTQPAQTAIVPLTSVAYPLQQVAYNIAEMVQSRLNGTYEGAPRCIKLKGTLVQRESVAAPAPQ